MRLFRYFSVRQSLACATYCIHEQLISFLKVLWKSMERIVTLLQFNTHCKGISGDGLESGLGLATPHSWANFTLLIQGRRSCMISLFLDWRKDTLRAKISCSIHFDWLIFHLVFFIVRILIFNWLLLDSLFHWFPKVDMLHYCIDVLMLRRWHAHWGHFQAVCNFILCTCSIDVNHIDRSLRLSKWDFEVVLA